MKLRPSDQQQERNPAKEGTGECCLLQNVWLMDIQCGIPQKKIVFVVAIDTRSN